MYTEIEEVDALCEEHEVDERSKQEGDEIKCKFCWNAECSKENPLLKACDCKGGLAFIHFSCLKTW